MNKEGELNTESSSRMNLAIAAFNNLEAPYIVTCGWAYRNDTFITLADAMKTYAIKSHGIPSDSIVTETTSRDTVGDAVFSKKNILLNRGWKKLMVITSDYHVSRVHEIFTYVYGIQYTIKVRGVATDRKESQSNKETMSTHAFHETFLGIDAGNDISIYKRLCEKHPYYNGLIHPKISDS